jgi:hypothetical protein
MEIPESAKGKHDSSFGDSEELANSRQRVITEP